MNKHFELTDTFIINNGIKLFQIRCIKNSKHSKKGKLGGYVESLDNLCDEAWVGGDVRVYGEALIGGNANIVDYACINDSAIITNNALIKSDKDYCYLSKFGVINWGVTAFKCSDGLIRINCWDFNGTLKEFEQEIIKEDVYNKYNEEYQLIIQLIKVKFGL